MPLTHYALDTYTEISNRLELLVEAYREADADARVANDRLEQTFGTEIDPAQSLRLHQDLDRANELTAKALKAVIDLPAVTMDDVLLKLEVWAEATGCAEGDLSNLSPLEQIVSGSFLDMKKILRG